MSTATRKRDRTAEREYDRARMRALREETLAEYGDGTCVVCGMAENLELDHVNGDGKEHRAQIGITASGRGVSGSAFYQWLKGQGFPNDPPLQLLCKPCHLRKTHEERRRTHCSRGHELTPENTGVSMRPVKDGTLTPRYWCHACNRARVAEWSRRQRKQ